MTVRRRGAEGLRDSASAHIPETSWSSHLTESRYDGLFDQTHYRLSMSLLSSPHLLFRRKRKNSCQCDRSEGGSGHQIPIDQAIHGSASINELKSLIMGFFATLYNNVPAAFPISGPTLYGIISNSPLSYLLRHRNLRFTGSEPRERSGLHYRRKMSPRNIIT